MFSFNRLVSSFMRSNRKNQKNSTTRSINKSRLLLEALEQRLTPTVPSVSTDFLDYAPGSIVTITASDFQPGATVEFLVVHVTAPGADGAWGTPDDQLGDNSGLGHLPWRVVDGGIGDIDGVVNGSIVTTWFVNADDSDGAIFRLTARDSGDDGVFNNADDNVAAALFTDAAGSSNKVYQHWADGSTPEWNNNILSSNKSQYFEGEVIPHLFIYKASNNTPLVNGQTYSFTISYNYYQGNSNSGGFAYLTTYDLSRIPGPDNATSPYIAPTPDSVFANSGGTQGIFSTVDADIISVSPVTYSGSGTLDASVTVTFKYTGVTTTSGIAEVYFGLMVAKPGDVPDQGAGVTKGASAWTGGSLQTTVSVGGSGGASIQVNPSAIIPGTISGIKFNDLNGDGVRQSAGADGIAGNSDDEAGLPGWTVYLDQNRNGQLDPGEVSTTTLADGSYSFSVIPDADRTTPLVNDPYTVREVAKAGWIATTALPDPVYITATSPIKTNVLFGGVQAASVGDTVWEDTNGNGIQEAGESGVANVTVQLLNGSGAVVATTSTGATGVYQFTNLLPGNYSVKFVKPAGYEFTKTKVGSNAGLDSDPDATTGIAGPFAVKPADAITSIDAGLYRPVSLGDFVWDDSNGNGQQDPAESGIAGVSVQLLNGSGAVVGTAVTSAGGAYLFTNLAPGTYSVRFLTPAGYVPTVSNIGNDNSDSDPVGGVTSAVTLASGGSNSTLDAGFYKPASVGDRVWDDTNGNGLQDPGEPGLANVTVELHNSADQTIASTTTNASGLYSFGNLAPGVYALVFLKPAGYAPVKANAGTDDLIDSDADPVSGRTSSISLRSGESNTTVDAGFNRYAPSLAVAETVLAVDSAGDGILNRAGDVVNYRFVVTNTGNQTLTGVVVTDPLTGVNQTVGTLLPGASVEINANYTLTQADIDSNATREPDNSVAGKLDSTVRAISDQTPTAQASSSVVLVLLPAISVSDLVTGVDTTGDGVLNRAGDVINYKIVVTNSGNQTLTGVVVTDPLTGVNRAIGTLVPGAVVETFANYTLTQADIDSNGTLEPNNLMSGSIDNTATVSSAQTPLATATRSVALTQIPRSSISNLILGVDTAGDGILNKAGDVINYKIVVTNTGNQTLTGVVVTDPLTGVNRVIGTLSPGAVVETLASYTLTQADIDSNGTLEPNNLAAGFLDSLATVVSNQAPGAVARWSVPLVQAPSLTVANLVIGVDVAGDQILNWAGETIDYKMVVTNTGNQTLTRVTVTDPLTGINQTIASLAPGAVVEIPAKYTLKQSDIDSNATNEPGNVSPGTIDNTVAVFSDQSGEVRASNQVFMQQSPRVTIDDVVVGVDIAGDGVPNKAGDVVNYKIVVTNTGNQTLTGVQVVDPLTGVNQVIASLAPGAVVEILANYTLKQSDIDSQATLEPDNILTGYLDNAPVVNSDQNTPEQDIESVQVSYRPDLSISLQYLNVISGNGNSLVDAAGDLLNYRVIVTNTGNVTLTNMTVTDPLTGLNIQGLSLLPGKAKAYLTSYALTQSDLDTRGGGDGLVDSLAMATSAETSSRSASNSVPIVWAPGISLVNTVVSVDATGNGIIDHAGEVISYSYTVSNTGNITLANVTVTDPLTGTNVAIGSLEVGGKRVISASYAVIQADIDSNGTIEDSNRGYINNTATATSSQLLPVTDSRAVPLTQLSSLGDLVWDDTNGNGQQDAGEPGIPGVSVSLVGIGGSVLATTTTDANGHYQFRDLLLGTYSVRFGTPAGYLPTLANNGADATDSDSVDGVAGPVVVSTTSANPTIDAGFYRPGSIGRLVWNDLNRNGQQDPNEPGIAGVPVQLLNGSGATIATMLTDASGRFAFTGLAPGQYRVTRTIPAGFVTTLADQGNDSTDSDANPVTVTMVSGGSDQSLGFGFYLPVSLGDRVWEDTNADGVQNSGEPGIAGVVVNLLDAAGQPVLGSGGQALTTLTAADGSYAFANLVPGTYAVQFVKPTGFVSTRARVGGNDALDSDANVTSGITNPVTLISGDSFTGLDAGFYRLAALGDRVWEDRNGNGQQDVSEPGIANVAVQLVDTAGNLIASTVSDANGAYSFMGLVPGVYAVRFTTPAGYAPTVANTGSDSTDSDPVSGVTGAYTVVSGELNTTADAGFYRPASLGDRVWEDRDGNGQQDAGESGLANVAVQLLNNGGQIVASATTDSNGSYSFANLPPGAYAVRFLTPSGYQATVSNAGNDASDSDAVGGVSGYYTLASGENNTTVDAGFYRPAFIGDRVWEDLNHNGQQDAGEPGIANVIINLLDASNTVVGTTTSGANGDYGFGNLAPGAYSLRFQAPQGYLSTTANTGADVSDSDPVGGVTGAYTLVSGEANTTVDAGFYRPASLGDRVWEDLNGNGQQDSGEPGIANVTVELMDAGNHALMALTDSTGAYSFGNLVPGTYSVRFTSPSGYLPTVANIGADATDSDPVQGLVGNLVLASGENNATVDAGFYRPASIGDRVWDDQNRNGQQDAGESGIPNATVQLLDAANNVVATTTTGATGGFSFGNLAPGVYSVRFSTPAGYTPTVANTGADVTDSDSVAGVAGPITLASGEFNTTVDAGFCKPVVSQNAKSSAYYTGSSGQYDLTGSATGITVKYAIYQALFNPTSGILRNPADLSKSVLVDANGNYMSLSYFSSYANLKSYLQGASTTNMAYRLSAQLLVLELNARLGYVNLASSVSVAKAGLAPALQSALTTMPTGATAWSRITTVDGGIASIQAVANAAIAHLRANPRTQALDGNRTYQDALASLMEAINGNQGIFIQP